MTTIAVRGGSMACDACHTIDSNVFVKMSKITRTEHGLLIGGAGDCSDRDFLTLMGSVKKPSQLPSLATLGTVIHVKSDIAALILFPNREIWHLSKDEDGPIELYRMHAPYAAIGSGSSAAMTAFRMGGSAYKAVEMAIEADINSRAPIYIETLPIRKRIVKKTAPKTKKKL